MQYLIPVHVWPQSGAKRPVLTNTLFKELKDQRKVQMMQITNTSVSKHNKRAVIIEVIKEDLGWVLHFQSF